MRDMALLIETCHVSLEAGEVVSLCVLLDPNACY